MTTNQPVVAFRENRKSFFRLVEWLIFVRVKVRLIQEPLRQGVRIAEGENAQSGVVPTVRVYRL
jgi:hypothetical protein